MFIFEPGINQLVIEQLKKNSILKLGYNAQRTLDPAIGATLDESLDFVRRFVHPKGICSIFPIQNIEKGSITTSTGTIHSAMFTQMVQMCKGETSIVFMAVTLGKELEDRASFQEPVYRQLVFDTVGSELAELMADMLESKWRKEIYQSGLEASQRFSPGYCDWALDGQGIFVTSLDLNRVGIHLSSNFVMMPSKSISAIAMAAESVPVTVPCIFCSREDCTSRRLHRYQHPKDEVHKETTGADSSPRISGMSGEIGELST